MTPGFCDSVQSCLLTLFDTLFDHQRALRLTCFTPHGERTHAAQGTEGQNPWSEY